MGQITIDSLPSVGMTLLFVHCVHSRLAGECHTAKECIYSPDSKGLPANVIPTKECIYSPDSKGLPANVIPTKECIYSLASLCISRLFFNGANNNRFSPFGRNDIVICPIVFTQGLPTNVIPTKERIYSLASLCISKFFFQCDK